MPVTFIITEFRGKVRKQMNKLVRRAGKGLPGSRRGSP